MKKKLLVALIRFHLMQLAGYVSKLGRRLVRFLSDCNGSSCCGVCSPVGIIVHVISLGGLVGLLAHLYSVWVCFILL
jgi:hypothetical protein